LKKTKIMLTAFAVLAATIAGTTTSQAETKKYVLDVKLIGVGWFDRMNNGVKAWATAKGIDATETGATTADPAKQVAGVQDLVAQKVSGIGVVPNDVASMEGVLGQAMAAGITVVTHEAASMVHTNADIEAFDNTAYGAMIMDNMAKCMGGSGQYAAFVGHVTAQSHMQWVAGALAQAKAKYPKITRIGAPIESNEDSTVAYQKTLQLFKKYPHLKGIEGSASSDVAGIGQAVDSLGLTGKVCVMGTSIPSVAGKYLKTGAITKIMFWDPAIAGQAILTIMDQLKGGKALTAGEDLGLAGYHSIKQCGTLKTTWCGNGWVIVDNKNMASYPF
jgi:simple sugar transport system substrate-binding protein